MRQPSARTARLVAAALAVPAIMIGVAAPASAAEITPIAEYVDTTVADTEAMLGGVLDALGLEAE
ncbi:hypothetical protein WCD74_22730 [Actinomycetospora sp. OC33-EN08]|uniref:Uncharacterized protein n=1 Tax=Actinomycetospora aurantiaca TaxID=3129233 RepID=A0ABU8MUD9_9PSEU